MEVAVQGVALPDESALLFGPLFPAPLFARRVGRLVGRLVGPLFGRLLGRLALVFLLDVGNLNVCETDLVLICLLVP